MTTYFLSIRFEQKSMILADEQSISTCNFYQRDKPGNYIKPNCSPDAINISLGELYNHSTVRISINNNISTSNLDEAISMGHGLVYKSHLDAGLEPGYFHYSYPINDTQKINYENNYFFIIRLNYHHDLENNDYANNGTVFKYSYKIEYTIPTFWELYRFRVIGFFIVLLFIPVLINYINHTKWIAEKENENLRKSGRTHQETGF